MAAPPIKWGPEVSARPYSMPARRRQDSGTFGLVGQGFEAAGKGLMKMGAGMDQAQENFDREQERVRYEADEARVNEAVAEASSNITTRTIGDAEHEAARQAVEAAFNEPEPEVVRRGDYVDVPLSMEDIETAGEVPTPQRQAVGEQVAELYARREQPGGVRGFLGTKGLSASQHSAEALATIEKDRARIRKGLANDRQRALFDQRTGRLYAATRERIELHVNEQNAATIKATSQVLQEDALTAVAADPGNDALAAAQGEVVEADIAAHAPSPAVAKLQAQAFHGRATEVRLRQFMGKGDWRGAKKVLESSGSKLSAPAREKFTGLVEKMELEVKGDALVSEAVRGAVMPNGKIDALAVEQAIDARTAAGLDTETGEQFPVDQKLRDEAKQRLPAVLNRAAKQWRDDTAALEQRVGAIYADKGWNAVPLELRNELRLRDYEAYLKLRDYERIRFDRARGRSDAELKREQDIANKLALLDYQNRGQSERLSLDVKSTYATSGANEIGVGEIGAIQRREKDAYDKGLLTGEDEFVDQAMASAEPFLLSKYSDKPKELAERRAAARAHIRTEFVKQASSGKLTREERERISADAISGVISGNIGKTKKTSPAPAWREDPEKPKPKKVRGPNGEKAVWDGVTPLPKGWTVTGG